MTKPRLVIKHLFCFTYAFVFRSNFDLFTFRVRNFLGASIWNLKKENKKFDGLFIDLISVVFKLDILNQWIWNLKCLTRIFVLYCWLIFLLLFSRLVLMLVSKQRQSCRAPTGSSRRSTPSRSKPHLIIATVTRHRLPITRPPCSKQLALTVNYFQILIS